MVTIRGDTLIGKVTITNMKGNIDRVWYQAAGSKRQLYTAVQLRSMVINAVSYKVINHYGFRFMLVEKEGYLNILRFREDGNFEFTQKLLYKIDGSLSEIAKLNFRKPIANFLNECDSLSKRIMNKELQYKDLETIVEEFNTCIANSKSIHVSKSEDKLIPVEIKDEPEPLNSDRLSLNEFLHRSDKLSLDELLQQIKDGIEERKSGTTDTSAIIGDIEHKISQGEKVPAYLINALKSTIGSDTVLIELVNRMESHLN